MINAHFNQQVLDALLEGSLGQYMLFNVNLTDMKFTLLLAGIALLGLSSCNSGIQSNRSGEQEKAVEENPLIGDWVRIGFDGPTKLEFNKEGKMTVDFGYDGTIDVVSEWKTISDTVAFTDVNGEMCKEPGLYKYVLTDYYLGLDMISDNCNGRIKKTMGYWTRPDFRDLVIKLDDTIAQTNETRFYLDRARIFIATGEPEKARSDLDRYIRMDSTNAKAYLNRAGTRFPDDMTGAVNDCNMAIALQPDDKNAYFLRGLALYQLGEKEKACEDFTRAIELGFAILKVAEQERCAEFWKSF